MEENKTYNDVKNAVEDNAQNGEQKKTKKTILIVTAILALLVLAYFLFFNDGGAISFAPTVTIETPEKKSETDREVFTVDVLLSNLRDDSYPAASFTINFDSSKLEFVGIEEGNVMVPCEEKANGANMDLPDWGVNVERSNEIGQINIMYVDLTAGKYAFSKDNLPNGDKVLFRLQFKLRGSAECGDIYELSIEDAVFAANDESESLASAKGSLNTRNGRIVVGD